MAESPLLKTDHAMGRLSTYCESHNLAVHASAMFGCFVLSGSYHTCVCVSIDNIDLRNRDWKLVT